MNEIETLQKRIKKLESENKRLKAENEKLKKESTWLRSDRATAWNMNEKSCKEACKLRKENAKLKCLALHGMIGYAVCKMNLVAEKYKDDEMWDFAVPIEFSKWHRKEIEWTKAYRKAKAELKELENKRGDNDDTTRRTDWKFS